MKSKAGYNRILLLVAGLGGLLFGVDVGIIAGALPYLEATSQLSSNQLSFIVAAVLAGGVVSTIFAGPLADLFGRKKMMVFSGALFVVSVPMIALSHSYGGLITGRLLQGISGGMIGVVVPLYLAECLAASTRGKGTGIFQWLLTLGILAAAVIGYYFSGRVDQVAQLGDADKLFHFKDLAWRSIFWVSLPPGILFVLGGFFVSESPRWLFRRGKKERALQVLRRSRSEEQAAIELKEMEEAAAAESRAGSANHDSLFQRKYIFPFLLACVILACNQATGVNSVIGYNATILLQAGLSDHQAHLGYVLLTLVNFLTTIGAVVLVDRKGRKFLLSMGTAGVIVSLLAVGLKFHKTESQRVDVRAALQPLVVASNQTATVIFDETSASQFLATSGKTIAQPKTLVVIYSYGDFSAASKVVRSDDLNAKLVLNRESCLPATKVSAYLKNPFANLDAARMAPLKIDHALITPVPSERNGWLTAVLIYCFMAFFAVGPGVCVWLALSELMPTRIRSTGMSIALFINIAVSAAIAGVFLPTVGQYGYSTMFFIFAGCTVVYFITATFIQPETKGKTLEEIEQQFSGGQ
jgi:SP family myo-inositol transporter-like MFS transporter 13